ncbi:MAG: hypothetical protein Roseis2KO_36510 [Roseivirga sp.]
MLKKREYQDALEAYQKAYDTYEAESFYEGMVYAKERMGRTYRGLGKDSLSKVTFQSAAALSREKLGPNHILESKAYLNNGIRTHRKRSYVEASKVMDSAMWAYEKATGYDSTMLVSIVNYKFYTYYYSNLSNDTLVKYLNEKGRIYEAMGASLNENVYLLSDYNRAFYRVGDFQKSVAYGLEAVRQSESFPDSIDPRFYKDALFHLSRSLHAQDNKKEALSVTSRLIEYQRKLDSQSLELIPYLNLKAVVFNGLDRYEEAATEFQNIVNLLEDKSIKDGPYIDAIMNLGVCYQKMGRIEIAKKFLRKALELQRGPSKSLDLIFTDRYKFLAQLYSSINQNEQALQYYDSALRSSSDARYTEGILQYPSEGALNVNYEVLSLLRDKQLTMELVHTNKYDEQALIAVMDYARKTHKHLIRNRTQLQASEGKLFLLENFKPLYESALNAAFVLFERSRDEQYLVDAVEFLSMSQSNLFIEQSGELGQIQDSRLDLTTKQRYYQVKKEIETYEQLFYQLFGDINTNDSLRVINFELLKLNSELEKIQNEIREVNVRSQRRNSEDIFYSLKSNLEQNQNKAIIDYFVGSRYTFVIAMTNGSNLFKRIELDDTFDKQFDHLLTSLSQKPVWSNYEQSLRKFQSQSNTVFEYLLGGIFKQMSPEINALTIIPDEDLSRLSFDVLISSVDSSARYFNQLDYLMKSYDINYSLSLGMICEAPPEKKAKKNLLGIGYTGGALTDSRGVLGSIPGTGEEISFLKSRFEGDFFLGENGTKSLFLKEAKDYDVLHLAVHGLANSNDRLESSLIFSGNNNVLRTSDLYVAGLNARLAVLSSCESGRGEINKGEGTFSIARGFALVGVPSIVMSLWKVNDESASKLMVGMHSNIFSGQTSGEGLATSKREYLLNSEQYTSHPYYWAAFVSLGQDVKVDKHTGLGFITYGIGTLILLIILIVFVRARKR